MRNVGINNKGKIFAEGLMQTLLWILFFLVAAGVIIYFVARAFF